MDPRIVGPKRLLCHAGVLVVALVCLRLGWWQWERSRELGGAAQNLAYAALWPVFGGYAIFVWVRLLWMEIRDEQPPAHDRGPVLGRPGEESGPGTALVRYVPPDPELLAYNAYLAELNEAAKVREADRRARR